MTYSFCHLFHSFNLKSLNHHNLSFKLHLSEFKKCFNLLIRNSWSDPSLVPQPIISFRFESEQALSEYLTHSFPILMLDLRLLSLAPLSHPRKLRSNHSSDHVVSFVFSLVPFSVSCFRFIQKLSVLNSFL